MPMMRIDKLVSQSGFGSRKEVKAILRSREVSVDGEVVTDPQTRVNPDQSVIYVGSEQIKYERYVYIMMNKPAGVISASYDEHDDTVCDILDENDRWFDLFPVGRLDKDTTGLLILSNDGGFAHRALSPKKHIEKVYHAEIDSPVAGKDVAAFAAGITLDDGYRCMPAVLAPLTDCLAEVIIREGKFHQVKRMFEAIGKNVVSLRRVRFADIVLDESLAPGEYRRLNDNEMAVIANIITKD